MAYQYEPRGDGGERAEPGPRSGTPGKVALTSRLPGGARAAPGEADGDAGLYAGMVPPAGGDDVGAGAAPGEDPYGVHLIGHEVAHGSTSGAEEPVHLPAEGGLHLALSSAPHDIGLELGDLPDLGIGAGKLTSVPIPVAEWLSMSAELGSPSPVRLTRPTLSLSPIAATISAEDVAQARRRDGLLSKGKKLYGGAAAAAGGILGGLLSPLAGMNPLKGAQAGGQAAGQAVTEIMDAYAGERRVRARLDQGEIRGELGLQYTPYLKLLFSATGLSWLVDVEASLQTNLRLIAHAAASLAGSEVLLHFRDGALVRTELTVRPSMRLGLTLEADGVLSAGATLLPVIKGHDGDGPGAEPGAAHLSVTTPPFHLFTLGGELGASFELSMARGDSFELLGRGLRAPRDAVRDRFTAGLRTAGPSFPIIGRRDELNDRSRTGQTEADPIPMIWWKPHEWYPAHLTWKPMSGRAQKIAKWKHDHYRSGAEDGPSMGVNDWPYPGKKMRYVGGEGRGRGVARFMEELAYHHIYLDDQLPYEAQIDHVIDLAFSGPDDETNLWPLESHTNMAAGGGHSAQRVWWSPDPRRAPQRTAIKDVPHGRWFVMSAIRDPGGITG